MTYPYAFVVACLMLVTTPTCWSWSYVESGSVIVNVPGYGTLNGTKDSSAFTGKTFYSFRNVYYGEKPTANTRFLPPVPKAEYPKGSIVQATSYGAQCNQPNGDEDCLSLGIFTRKLPGVNGFSVFNRRLPVFCWFHGGGNAIGNASLYLPHRLMEEEIVLVVAQYRLNSLGFLSFNTDDVPGNAGLFDQIEALRWIKTNIESFGGDPNTVTIAGESAGAWDVSLHLVIPQSKGLFHRAIIQSGSAVYTNYIVGSAADTEAASIQIARLAGCPTSPYSAMLNCVRTVSASTLSLAYVRYNQNQRATGTSGGYRGSTPTIQIAGTQRVLEQSPTQLYNNGQFARVPVLLGTNEKEGTYVLGQLYRGYLAPNNLQNNSTFLANDLVGVIVKTFLGISDDSGAITSAYTAKYFKGAQLGNFQSMIPGLIDLCGTLFLKAPTYDTAYAIAKYNLNTYLYSFNFPGRFSFFDGIYLSTSPALPFSHGVSHGDELMYLFDYDYFFHSSFNATETTLSKKMLRVWADFIKYGKPYSPLHAYTNVLEGIPTYPRFNRLFGKYMQIDSSWRLRHNFPNTYTTAVDTLSSG